jgi:Zn-dependent protease
MEQAMAETVLNAGAVSGVAAPETVHTCPGCGNWLPDGTLACPECQALTYGRYLGTMAAGAQALEQQGKLPAALEQWRQALQWLPETTQQAANIRQHMATVESRIAAEKTREAKWKKRLGPFAPIALFLIKAKSAIFLLFKLKFLIGFLAFFGIYWALFGWKFAAGFMICLTIHEAGHYVAVKRRGLKADLPMFLPGLGAYVRWYHEGVSREDLAAISLAGPLYGLVAALACAAIWWGTRMGVFLVLANVGAWVNLFNLTPVLGFDGAKAVYAMSRLQRSLIAALCFVFFGLTVNANGGGTLTETLMGPNTQWMFAIVGVGMVWRCFSKDEPEMPHTGTMIYFLGLVLALGFLLLATARPIAMLTAQ